MKNFYTTKEFAEELGLTDAYVRQLILGGKVESEKVGRDHLIPAVELEKTKLRRTKRGPEPKKESAAEASPPAQTPKKLTAAQKQAIADEQQRRRRNETPGKKAAKKGTKKQ